MAIDRYDGRKQLVLEEANAIATAHLRTDLLPASERATSRRLLRDYVDARLAFFAAGSDETAIAAANASAAATQQRLWTIATRVAAEAPQSIPAGLYVEAINLLVDLGEARLRALQNHIPETVIALVLLLAMASIGFIGVSCGIEGRRRLMSTSVVAMFVVLVVGVIIDLDRPRRGLVRVSQDSLVALQAQMAADQP